MKKINKLIIILILILVSINPVYAKEEEVKFKSCIDGDTIKVEVNNEVKTVRFLAVDTPETKHPTKKEEPYGKEASNYTCDKVSKAKKIVLEYDDNSEKEDKYNRLLAWIWVDDSLLQKELINNGLAKVAYLYDNYKYTEELQLEETKAKLNKVGIWSDNEENPLYTYLAIFLIVITIIAIITIPKYRNKAIKKAKRQAKNKFNKYMNKVLK